MKINVNINVLIKLEFTVYGLILFLSKKKKSFQNSAEFCLLKLFKFVINLIQVLIAKF